jgi:DNA end-binding protein Ku
VIGRRERAVVLEPRGEGIVAWTLRFGDEVRPEEPYFEDIDDRSDPDLVPLVQEFIKQHTKEWSPDMVSDPVQDALLDIIATKKKALRPSKKGKTNGDDRPSGGNVIDIMDALRKSLAAGEKGKRAS